jgi:hypothetical protein
MKIIIALIIFTSLSSGQNWYKGEAVAVGGDDIPIAKLRQQALMKARVNALEQAGISIQSSATIVKSESRDELIDIYGAFAQSNSRGIIIKEKNTTYASAITDKDGTSIVEVRATLEAFVGIPEGKPDYTFAVDLRTNKKAYYEGDDLEFQIESSLDGFLTLFEIKNDTCFILYPHPLIPKSNENKIFANIPITIPPISKAYSYEMNLDGEDGKNAVEFLVAIVTKERSPIGGVNNTKKYFTLEEYNQWLMNIPVDKRCAASASIVIVKK